MSQATVIFNFRGNKKIIQCNNSEKMKNICEKFISQLKENKAKICFKYNNNIIKEELKFEEQINEIDKSLNSMIIIVEEEKEEKKLKLNKNNINSREIIYRDKMNYLKDDGIINKMIDNYIIAEIVIKENDINKDIRIINSYEEYQRNEIFSEYKEEYENENEIKENCEIKINDRIIPFSYYYEFKKEGK